mgnify:FL=1
MAIEKSLFAAPLGEDVEVVEAIEIEIEPEVNTLEDGSVEIMLVSETDSDDIDNARFDANLAEYMDDGQLIELSTQLVADVEADTQSRREWADTFVKGMQVLGFN